MPTWLNIQATLPMAPSWLGLEEHTNLGSSTAPVISKAFDNDRNFVRRETFVGDDFVIDHFTGESRALFYGPLDGVTGHGMFLGGLNRDVQPRIQVGVGATGLGGDNNFFGEFAENLAAFERAGFTALLFPLCSHGLTVITALPRHVQARSGGFYERRLSLPAITAILLRKEMSMKRFSVTLAITVSFCVVCVVGAAAKDKNDDTKVGDTEFTTYDGSQSWPTGTTAITNGEYSIPIYIGLPAKSYKVIGRITDKRDEGIDVVGKAFDEGLGSEKHRMRNCANQAKQHGADAVLVTDDDRVIKVFNLTRKELHESTPLFHYEHSVVLAIKF